MYEFKEAYEENLIVQMLIHSSTVPYPGPRPHNPNLVVIFIKIQTLTAESYRPKCRPVPIRQEKTDQEEIGTILEPNKETCTQGSISPESYFRFHIRVTGGLG